MNRQTEMSFGELGELYRLFRKYEQIYGRVDTKGNADILTQLKVEYETRAYRINGPSGWCLVPAKISNARNAGRLGKFSDGEQDTIIAKRKEGMTIREVARQMHCSVGYVHKLISEHDREEEEKTYELPMREKIRNYKNAGTQFAFNL